MPPRTRLFIVAGVAIVLVSTVLTLLHYLISYSLGIDLYGRAMREMDDRDYDAAIALFDSASRKKLDANTLSFVYGNRGWAYSNKGLDDQAIRDFSESIRLNPEPYYAFWDRALAYHRKGEFEKALTDYNATLARAPNLASAYHGRAQIFEGRGDLVKAIANYSEAIRCEPNNAQFFVDRGMAFLANSEPDRAISNFDAAIEFNPTHAGAYIQRAAAYADKGNWTKGMAGVTEAIRQRPEARQLWYARAMIYLDRGAVEEAIADCDEALRIAPDYDLGFLTRAKAEAMVADWDKVFRDTATALELDPTLSRAHYLRGRGFIARGEFDQAISAFNEALRLEPGFQWAIVFRAATYGYRGENSRALRELKEAVERFPGAMVPHMGLAWFQATCSENAYRNGAEAIEHALKGCETSYWRYSPAIDVLGAAYAEHGEFDRAIEFTNLALSLPGSPPRDGVLMKHRLFLYQNRIAVRDLGGPGVSRNLIEEGVSAFARDDYDRALRCFNAVLPPNPGASIAAILLLSLYGNQDKTGGVPWAPSKGAPITTAFYYRGVVYERMHQWDNAIADFTTAIRREPESTIARRERGVTYGLKGETDRALQDFDEVIRMKPDDALAYALRADTLHLMKQWDAALDAATAAIKLDPGLAAAYHIRGRAYAGKKDYENADRQFSEADRLGPPNVSRIHDRAAAFVSKGDYESAQLNFRQAVQRFPRSADAHNALAWFLATCSDVGYRNGAEAVKYARSACELTQWKNAAQLDTLAAAYAETGDFDQAIKYGTEAIDKMDPRAGYRGEIEGHLALFQQKEAYHAKPPE